MPYCYISAIAGVVGLLHIVFDLGQTGGVSAVRASSKRGSI